MCCPNCSVELSQRGDRLCCPVKDCGFTVAVSTVKRIVPSASSEPAKDPNSAPADDPQRRPAFADKDEFEAWKSRREGDIGLF